MALTPAERNRLQKQFQYASANAAKGAFDLATEMFTQCVTTDPGNLIYVQNFLGNLQKKYNNNKKGKWSLSATGLKASVKKASLSKQWDNVLKSGYEVLKLNPWDVGTLTAMAYACEQLEFDDCQLAYLKLASEVDLKDVDVNRLRGRALERVGQFDEAIVCWTRVVQAKPEDEEARRSLADLQVKKTIRKGRYEEAETSQDVRANADEDPRNKTPRLTPEQQLEKEIAKNPEDIAKYRDLADIYLRNEDFAQAKQVLTRALQASGGDLAIRELLEDIEIRGVRQQVEIAEKKARSERTDEAVALYKQMSAEMNRKELEVYRDRAERYPSNLGLKFDLGLRLQRAGNHNEAIKVLQEARGDSKRKGQVLLALGECFQAIKQYKLALNNYEAALAEISPRDEEALKLALYRAGKLALFSKAWEQAERHLNDLAGRDFGYKDVADLLDKLNKFRDDVGSGSGESM